jgi:hypothetical protein
MPSFDTVRQFEELIANYFGSRYGVATDCCTHAIELSLRYDSVCNTSCPKHTYLSVPMTLSKLGIEWNWNLENWDSYYFLPDTRIVDAAVLWKKNSYIHNFKCINKMFTL